MNIPAASTNSASEIEPAIRRAAARIVERCAVLATCSDLDGQIARLFCTPAMQAAHGELRSWMAAVGMQCRLDPAGNLIGRYETKHRAENGTAAKGAPAQALLIGSHLDSVVNAGKYDGVLGVMVGLALAEIAAETGASLPFALEAIGFCEEEGVRFQTPYIGSRAMVGTLTADVLELRDADGIRMAESLRNFGGSPEQIKEAGYQAESVVAYIEPHIEQGPVLEIKNLPVGIVSGIAGQTRASFQFSGKAGHAGTVPMSARHDALTAAAEFVLAVEELARSRPNLVATVGRLEVSPNVANVIAAEVNLRLDLRHLDDDARDAAFRELVHQAALIAEEREIEFDMLWSQQQPATSCDSRLIGLLAQSVAELGVQPLELASGAGHDAVMMAKKFPTAMLFVRCAGGVSHHPDESVTEADVAVALRVLWQFIGKLAASDRPVHAEIPTPSSSGRGPG